MPKRKLKNSVKWFGAVLVTAVLAIVLTFFILNQVSVKPTVNWEQGTALNVSGEDFFTRLPKDKAPVIETDLSVVDTNLKGSYDVVLTLEGKTYKSKLVIVDTTAPTAETRDVTVEVEGSVTTDQFILTTNDLGEVTVSFKSDPDLSQVKDVNVTLILSDDSGNSSEVTAVAHVVNDLTPPEITIEKPLYIEVNAKNPDYWAYASATDAKSTIATKTFDDQDVKLNRIGNYTVNIIATDSEGNSRVTMRDVHVVYKATYLTMQALWSADNNKAEEAAQAVYDQIIKADMTQREKMRAVYDYLVDEMTYRSNYSNDYNIDSYNKMDDYAISGFNNLYGNCFNYASMAAILLDKIGMEVTLIKGEGYSYTAETHFVLHYWILVNVDGKTYHFDPLYEWLYKRIDKAKDFFLVKDAQVYDLTHRWDTTLYPVSPK